MPRLKTLKYDRCLRGRNSVVECQLPKLEPRRASAVIAKTYGNTPETPNYNPNSCDPELSAIVAAWPALSEPIKAGIVAMVKASTPERGE
jgi:hypothetical protein